MLSSVSLQLMCTVDDLKEMGIPLGPRKKLAKFVKEKAAKQVNTNFFYFFLKAGAVWPWP